MPTYRITTKAASGFNETRLVKGIFADSKSIIRDALNTDTYPLDPQTGVTGALVEVNLMESRFDLLVDVDALATQERLDNAVARVRNIRDDLKAIAGARNRVGVWLHLRGHTDDATQTYISGESFWCSTYDED